MKQTESGRSSSATTIFQRYLELGSLNRLLEDLRARKLLTRVRTLSTGRTVGVVYKGEVCPGEQPAILDRDLFEAVQKKLAEQRTNHATGRAASESLLMGRIFDDRGNRMTPSFAGKAGKRYRYYISSALMQPTRPRTVANKSMLRVLNALNPFRPLLNRTTLPVAPATGGATMPSPARPPSGIAAAVNTFENVAAQVRPVSVHLLLPKLVP